MRGRRMRSIGRSIITLLLTETAAHLAAISGFSVRYDGVVYGERYGARTEGNAGNDLRGQR